MKLRKTMVVLLLLVFAIGMTAFVGCGDKDNRKESEKYELVITDTKNPVSITGGGNHIYTYKYDGEDHYPTVVMMYDGKPSDIEVDVGAQVYKDNDLYHCGYPNEIGMYELTYFHDSFLIESEHKRFNITLQIKVIIEE